MKNKHNKNLYVYPVLLIVLAILVNGCSMPGPPAPIQPQNIVVPPHEISSLEINTVLKDNIHLYDVIGDEINSFWSINLEVIDFRAALNQSLLDAHYLGNPLNSDYDLRAKLLDIDKPSIGFNFTATTTVEYILKERNSGEEILKETIVETYTAKLTDRLSRREVHHRMVIEMSVKKNLYQLLQALSELKIEKS